MAHCIICGTKDTATFLYRKKDITVCMCAMHINSYINKELYKPAVKDTNSLIINRRLN